MTCRTCRTCAACWCTVYHGVSVLNSLTVRTAMLLNGFNDIIVGALVCPIALVLKQNLQRSDRYCTSLFNTAHGGIVGCNAGSTGSVLNGIHFIAGFNCFQSRECQTDFSPEGCHDQFLASGCGNGFNKFGVFPRVHTAALDWFLVRKDV